MSERDEELGRLLGDLDVPDHAPGFWSGLDARLAGTDELAARRARRARRPERRRSIAAAVSVAAALAVVAGAVSLTQGTDDDGTTTVAVGDGTTTSAAVPTTEATTTTAADTEIVDLPDTAGIAAAGTYTQRIDDGPAETFEVTLGSAGGFSERRGREAKAYDQRTRTFTYDNGGGDAGRIIGDAPRFSPDDQVSTFLPLDLAAHVAARAESGDESVRPDRHLDRDVWVATVDHAVTDDGLTRWRAEVMVDQATLLPLRVVEDRDGTTVVTECTSFDAPVDDASTTLEVGLDAEIVDRGFRVTTLRDARTRRPVLEPTTLPEGFALTQVLIDDAQGIVSLVHQRAWRSIVVSTRSAAAPRGNPFARFGAVESRPLRISGGALDGQAGQLVDQPPTPPHVWVGDDELDVTVSGNVAYDTLVAIASSLRR